MTHHLGSLRKQLRMTVYLGRFGSAEFTLCVKVCNFSSRVGGLCHVLNLVLTALLCSLIHLIFSRVPESRRFLLCCELLPSGQQA